MGGDNDLPRPIRSASSSVLSPYIMMLGDLVKDVEVEILL